MAITNGYSALGPVGSRLANNRGLVSAMTGTGNALTPLPLGQRLPQSYGFNDLAEYEKNKRNLFGGSVQEQIGKLRTGIDTEYGNTLNTYKTDTAKRRADLASSLSSQGQETFKLANPYILEDLQSRGVFSSPTAINTEQARALQEIALKNQSQLSDFDTTSRTYEDQLAKARLDELNAIESSGYAGNIQAQQDALDAEMNAYFTKLEQDKADQAAAQERSLAESLADKQNKNNLTAGLISGGGSIVGGLLPSLLAGGGGASAGGATAGALGGTAAAGGVGGAAAGGGIGSVLLPAAGVGAALGLYEEGRKALAKQGADPTTSKILASVPGVGLGVAGINKITGGKMFGGKTAKQQGAIDVGTSTNEKLNGILSNIQAKGGVGTFNEGQIITAADEADKLEKEFQAGQIPEEDYYQYLKNFFPGLYGQMHGYMGSGSAGAKAFNNTGIANRMISINEKYNALKNKYEPEPVQAAPVAAAPAPASRANVVKAMSQPRGGSKANPTVATLLANSKKFRR